MPLRSFFAVFALLLGMPLAQALAACYTVYDAGAMVVRTDQTPVDLTQPIGEGVRERFGAQASMVMVADDADCELFGAASEVAMFEGASWARFMAPNLVESPAGASVGRAYYGGGRAAALGYPHVGPRGGQFRLSAAGNKIYRPKGR